MGGTWPPLLGCEPWFLAGALVGKRLLITPQLVVRDVSYWGTVETLAKANAEQRQVRRNHFLRDFWQKRHRQRMTFIQCRGITFLRGRAICPKEGILGGADLNPPVEVLCVWRMTCLMIVRPFR